MITIIIYSTQIVTTDDSNKSHVNSHVRALDFCKCSIGEIFDAIPKLKFEKSAGIDSLQCEHFKYADPNISGIFHMIFHAMLIHGYVSSKMMETVIIVPIVKDKKGLVTDKYNYRPIAITSVLSKILELVLLERLQTQLGTACNQFGFKNKLGTCLYIETNY